MSLFQHIIRLGRLLAKARERSAAIRLDRELSAAGLQVSQHRAAARCTALGRTIKRRRQAVTEMLRREVGHA